MRNGVGRTGSVPPVNSTASARSAGQSALGRIVRKASCGMLVFSRIDGRLAAIMPASRLLGNASLRLEVDQRCAVEKIEAAHLQRRAIDRDQIDNRGSN